MYLIDTHCHIDLDEFDEDRAEVFQRADEAGVRDMLVIGFEPERWQAAEALAERCRGVRVAAGLHPNSADRFSQAMLDDIARQTEREDVIAIGETGIDLYWEAVPLETQQAAFRAQIELSQDRKLPFIVHQRDAEVEVVKVLESYPAPLSGVLHCFTGDWDYAQRVLACGMHIGLGGAITFKSRTELHDAAARIPLDRVVLETDAPFMAPVPYRGKRNEPAYVREVAARLAELRGVSVEEIAEVTTENARRLFQGLGSRRD